MAILFSHELLAGIASSIASAILSAFAHAMSSGITSLAAWAIGGLAHAATATTAVNLSSWFQGPWRAMLTVAGLAALPLFLAGVLESLAHGEGVAGLAGVVGRLMLAGVGVLIALALALVQLLLALVDVSCEVVERTSGISISAALARLGTALGVTASVGGGGVAAIGALLLALLAALAALVLWLELAMRTVLILVTTAFLPLGLSGLLWPKTASWLRRLGEMLTAIAISKLVIVVVLVLGAAALTNSAISLTTPGADIDAMVNGIAFLGLATLGLPIALRVVPFAAEAALSAGRGGLLMRSGYAASRLAAGASSTSTLARRVRGTSSSGAAGGGGGGSTPPRGAVSPGPGGGSPGGPSGRGPGAGGSTGSGPAGSTPGGRGPRGTQGGSPPTASGPAAPAAPPAFPRGASSTTAPTVPQSGAGPARSAPAPSGGSTAQPARRPNSTGAGS
jgi:hypothetical protein